MGLREAARKIRAEKSQRTREKLKNAKSLEARVTALEEHLGLEPEE